jgi:hypothetical protein
MKSYMCLINHVAFKGFNGDRAWTIMRYDHWNRVRYE